MTVDIVFIVENGQSGRWAHVYLSMAKAKAGVATGPPRPAHPPALAGQPYTQTATRAKIISGVRGRGGGLLDRWPSALGGRGGRRSRHLQAPYLGPAQQFLTGAVAAQRAVLHPQLEQEPL